MDTMASMVALRGLILICLLQLSVQEDVNKVALAKMIQYFDDNVQPKHDAQYAIAIRLTKKDCTDENFSIETVFSRAEAEKVKTIINGNEICINPKNVIAAMPKLGKPRDHAEYRLLYPVGNSPMDKLLENLDKNSCVVFYTYNSPCVQKCIKGDKNILEGLSNWKNKQEGAINVFVFRNVWQNDYLKTNLTKEFQKIDVIVPLYQCPEAEQINCFKCWVQQATSYCLTIQDKKDSLNYDLIF